MSCHIQSDFDKRDSLSGGKPIRGELFLCVLTLFTGRIVELRLAGQPLSGESLYAGSYFVRSDSFHRQNSQVSISGTALIGGKSVRGEFFIAF
jgi:hypothetical protein